MKKLPMELGSGRVALSLMDGGTNVAIWDRNWSPVPRELHNLRSRWNDQLFCPWCGPVVRVTRKDAFSSFYT